MTSPFVMVKYGKLLVGLYTARFLSVLLISHDTLLRLFLRGGVGCPKLDPSGCSNIHHESLQSSSISTNSGHLLEGIEVPPHCVGHRLSCRSSMYVWIVADRLCSRATILQPGCDIVRGSYLCWPNFPHNHWPLAHC
jgi:hypothetical protein